MDIKQALFGNLDFNQTALDNNFKEADVSAVIIDPVLKELGFAH
jgi:hypothetical protein